FVPAVKRESTYAVGTAVDQVFPVRGPTNGIQPLGHAAAVRIALLTREFEQNLLGAAAGNSFGNDGVSLCIDVIERQFRAVGRPGGRERVLVEGEFGLAVLMQIEDP